MWKIVWMINWQDFEIMVHSCLKEDNEVIIFFTSLHSDNLHCDDYLQHKLSEIIRLSDNHILTRYLTSWWLVRVYKTSCQVFCLLKKFFGPKGQFLEEVLTKVLACFELHPVRNSALIFHLGYNILKLHMRRKWLYVSQRAKKIKRKRKLLTI